MITLVLGLVLAAIGAAIHVYVFALESLLWTTERARAVFGTSPDEAAATRELAFNQGFYNLFLAVITGIGIGCFAFGQATAGAALVFAGCGSMVAAGLVLAASAPSRLPAALIQAGPPLAAIVLTGLGLAS